jgi:hypothetical protein
MQQGKEMGPLRPKADARHPSQTHKLRVGQTHRHMLHIRPRKTWSIQVSQLVEHTRGPD